VRRRSPQLVAWGGRPGVDIQIGSRRDRYRELRLQRLAHLQRLGESLTETFRAMGAAANAAFRPVAELAGQLEGVDADTMLERWKRGDVGRA
jgi:hypothetical protein